MHHTAPPLSNQFNCLSLSSNPFTALVPVVPQQPSVPKIQERLPHRRYCRVTQEQRSQIMNMLLNGINQTTIAFQLKLPYTAVASVVRTFKKEGRIVAKPHHARETKYNNEMKESICVWQEENAELTLQQLKDKFAEKYTNTPPPSYTTIERILKTHIDIL